MISTITHADILDECKCGDYRKQHEHGTGACILCRNDFLRGVPWAVNPCQKFRLRPKRAMIPASEKVATP